MKEYSREISSAPFDLVQEGQIQFACFDDSVKNLNFIDAYRPFGFPLPKVLKNMRLKEWQAMQLGNEDYFILIALYNAKALSVNQFILYDKKNKKLYKYEKKTAFWNTKVASNMQKGLSRYENKNFRIEILSNLINKNIKVKVNIRKYKQLPNVAAEFKINYQLENYSPLVVSIPFGKNRGMYSYKNIDKVQGTVYLNNDEIRFKAQNSFGIIDDHKGYYPYNMKYDWVTGAAFINHKLYGFNLTDNQSINPEQYNENALWNNGKLYLLPPVKFDRSNKNQWHIVDKYGMVDLYFIPETENKLNFNLGLIKADYSGPFGGFKGFIKYAAGKKIETDDFFGMGEKKIIRS